MMSSNSSVTLLKFSSSVSPNLRRCSSRGMPTVSQLPESTESSLNSTPRARLDRSWIEHRSAYRASSECSCGRLYGSGCTARQEVSPHAVPLLFIVSMNPPVAQFRHRCCLAGGHAPAAMSSAPAGEFLSFIDSLRIGVDRYVHHGRSGSTQCSTSRACWTQPSGLSQLLSMVRIVSSRHVARTTPYRNHLYVLTEF